MGLLRSEEIIRLLKKYGLVLILFELATRFGVIQIRSFYFQLFPMADLWKLNELNALITTIAYLFCDLVIALIMLKDLDKDKSLTWIIIGITLFSPWTSIVFLLIWKVAELSSVDTKH